MPVFNYTNIGDVIKHLFFIGAITAFDYENQTATVRTVSPNALDNPATEEDESAYTPVSFEEYTGVKFFYHCDNNSVLKDADSIEKGITGFAIGDEVIVEASLNVSNELTDLKIVAHTDEPRKCKRIRIYQTYIEGGDWYIGVYDVVNGELVKTQTLNPKTDFNNRYDIQTDKPIYIINAHVDTNKLFVVCHYKAYVQGSYYIWPLILQYRIRWIYDIDDYYYSAQRQWDVNSDLPFAFNCGEPWNNGMMAGGYKAFTCLPTFTSSYQLTPYAISGMWKTNLKRTVESDYTGKKGTYKLPWLAGIDNVGEANQNQEFGWPCFQTQNIIWIDDNNNNIFNEVGQSGTTSFSTEIDPPDYYQRYVQVRGIGFVGMDIILGVLVCYDDENTEAAGNSVDGWYPSKCDPCQDKFIVDCFIAVFEGPTYNYAAPFLFEVNEPIRWETPRFLDFEKTRLTTISSISEFERINQILGYDERIFISYREPAEIHLYTKEGAFVASTAIEADNLCTMSIVESSVNLRPCLACQSFGGNMVFYDVDTLEIVESYTIPDTFVPPGLLVDNGVNVNERQSSVAVNVPINTYASYLLEVYRYIYGEDDTKVVYHSPLACRIAQEHANWCIENARMSHVGKDDLTVHERMAAVGVEFCAENLTIQWSNNPVLSCILGWDTSPGHKENLLYPTDEGVGWGVATYPSACKTITVGPGMYIPETGGYTTEDSDFIVPNELLGRIMIYVFIGFGW